jgi:hypothetical protein
MEVDQLLPPRSKWTAVLMHSHPYKRQITVINGQISIQAGTLPTFLLIKPTSMRLLASFLEWAKEMEAQLTSGAPTPVHQAATRIGS